MLHPWRVAPYNKRNSEAAWRKKNSLLRKWQKKTDTFQKQSSFQKKGENIFIESEKKKNLHEQAFSAYLTKDERNKLIELLLKVYKSASEMEE